MKRLTKKKKKNQVLAYNKPKHPKKKHKFRNSEIFCCLTRFKHKRVCGKKSLGNNNWYKKV